MDFTPSTTHQKAFTLGAIAGMRAMSAPSIVASHYANSPTIFLEGSNLGYLQKSGVATGLKVLSVAEFITDKLPQTPDRIAPMQLAPRILSGALVGATIAEANNESKLTGALIGVVGAVASAYAFFYLRKALGNVTGLPDTAFALVEDALAYKVGTAALS